jgi:Fe-S-cluster containining protein
MVDLSSTGIRKDNKLRDILKKGEQCERCGSCCRYGTGFLADDDLNKISKELKIDEKEVKEKYLEEVEHFNRKMLRPKTKKKPFGECVFLDKTLCSIQNAKPLHCRIGNCKSEELSAWFLLNYVLDSKDPEAVRQYNIYLGSGGKLIEGGRLKDLVPDEKELNKIINFEKMR